MSYRTSCLRNRICKFSTRKVPPSYKISKNFHFPFSWLLVLIFKYLFICLHWVLVAACGIFSYGMQTIDCGLWVLVPWPGTKPQPLHWEHRVFASGPPGKCLLVLVILVKMHSNKWIHKYHWYRSIVVPSQFDAFKSACSLVSIAVCILNGSKEGKLSFIAFSLVWNTLNRTLNLSSTEIMYSIILCHGRLSGALWDF